MMRFFTSLIVLFSFLLHANVGAQVLFKKPLNEENYFLVSIYLDGKIISQSSDVYIADQHTLISIEPLFDALQLKYQLRKDSLQLWKDDTEFTFIFDTNVASPDEKESHFYWADDGYYQFIDLQLLENIYGASLSLDKRKLHLNVTSPSTQDYLFPITVIAQQQEKRLQNRIYKDSGNLLTRPEVPITIPDQYRLITMPHGQIFARADLENNEQKYSGNVQLTGDFLYHSTSLNLSKTTDRDLSGGLTMTRYKKSREDRILGIFDSYSLGDIYSYNGGGLVSSGSGVGINVMRGPENYRSDNTQITLQQQAPPGWEAELFRNNAFVASTRVPETGLLVFENVEIYYGNNDFKIKIYGPFGEEDVFQKNYTLQSNPLAGGDMAYSMYAYDPNKSVFNNEQNNNNGLELNNYGAKIDYGINDFWQVGAFVSNNNRQLLDGSEQVQILGIKNNLSLPGMLFENQITVNQNADYSQISSLAGQLLSTASYQISFASSKSSDPLYNSPIIGGINNNLVGANTTSLSAAYIDNIDALSYNFRVAASNADDLRFTTFSNTLFYNRQKLNFTNSLSYTTFEQTSQDADINSNSLIGNFGIAGSLFNRLRVSANLVYDPTDSDFIKKSSTLTAQFSLDDPFDLKHYFTFNYRPLDESDNSWSLVHNLSYETNAYRLSLSSSYKQNNDWSIGLFVNFFIGYDYLNNRALTSSRFSSNSATLNIHTYLDRQLNGVPDVLDYDLEGVEFTGNPDWEGLRSGNTGRILLPGANVNAPFSFRANWLAGSNPINNDYTIYTHPGARVDVNMPFYLSTELAGFVYREAENGQIPMTNMGVELIDQNDEVVQNTQTDSDGYYEFINMKPNHYRIRVTTESLRQKSVTANIVGFDITSPSVGGFAELPVINLRQQANEQDYDDETLEILDLPEEDQELLIWNDDESIRQNYFTLPTKSKIQAKHSLDQVMTDDPIPDLQNMSDNSVIAAQDNTVKEKTSSNSKMRLVPVSNSTNVDLSGNYTLQLGAFSEEVIATNFANAFNNQAYTTQVIQRKSANKKLTYFVFLGQFKSEADAVKYASDINLRNNDFMLKKLQNNEIVLMSNRDEDSVKELVLEIDLDDYMAVNTSTNTNNVNTPPTWVIQFLANPSPLTGFQSLPFSAIGNIYSAQKVLNNSNKLWYCLISDNFVSKDAALEAMKRANVGGWVVETSIYTNIMPVN
jgi:hypothetical protein